MIRENKFISLIVIPLFAFPIITSFCCCVELPWQKGYSHEHSRHSDHHHQDDAVQHTKSNGSSDCGHHDHSQCDHSQLIADLASCKVHSLSSVSSMRKLFKSLSTAVVFPKADSIKENSSPPYLDTGPPDFSFSFTPLYLRFSVLQI